MESFLAPNNERKETDPLNLDKTNPKKKQLKPKYAITHHKKF
ncbi:hypothetical protein ID0440_09770 [Helicobacter pylori]